MLCSLVRKVIVLAMNRTRSNSVPLEVGLQLERVAWRRMFMATSKILWVLLLNQRHPSSLCDHRVNFSDTTRFYLVQLFWIVAVWQIIMIIQMTMFSVLSCAEISALKVHSDLKMTHCTALGGRRLDGDSLNHTHFNSALKWLPKALRHQHNVVLLPNPKAVTHFAVPCRVTGWVGPDTAGKVLRPVPKSIVVLLDSVRSDTVSGIKQMLKLCTQSSLTSIT